MPNEKALDFEQKICSTRICPSVLHPCLSFGEYNSYSYSNFTTLVSFAESHVWNPESRRQEVPKLVQFWDPFLREYGSQNGPPKLLQNYQKANNFGIYFWIPFLKLWSSVGASWEPSKRQTFQEIDRMARMTHRVAALEQQATRRAGTAQFEEPTPQASPQKNSRDTDQ